MAIRSWTIRLSFLFMGSSSTLASDSLTYQYTNAQLINDRAIASGELWVRDGKFISPQDHADVVTDLKGQYVAPGYIDLQINGAFGVDFSINPERVGEVARQLPQHGVTSFLPTLVSLAPEQYRNAIPKLQPSPMSGATNLGIHLEGPFFSPRQYGAHNPSRIVDMTEFNSMYGSLDGVKIITLAPELQGALPIIKQLREKGIVVSAGHTMASYDEMQQAITSGVTLSTHLFNAMTPVHHRNPGIVGAVLNNPNMFYSVIADGVHLHPAILNIALKSNPKGLVLVTDAIEALGLPDGIYALGNMDVDVKDGSAHIKGTQTIAGSVLRMDQAVRNLRQQTGCSIVEAIEAATLKPAKVLGLEKQKGTLDVGADADFVILDENLNVNATYISGSSVWHR